MTIQLVLKRRNVRDNVAHWHDYPILIRVLEAIAAQKTFSQGFLFGNIAAKLIEAAEVVNYEKLVPIVNENGDSVLNDLPFLPSGQPNPSFGEPVKTRATPDFEIGLTNNEAHQLCKAWEDIKPVQLVRDGVMLNIGWLTIMRRDIYQQLGEKIVEPDTGEQSGNKSE